MLVKANDVIGAKIISLDTGKEIKKIEDVIYDGKENKVLAFLVDSGGLFSNAKVIFLEDTKGIGKDAVIIESEKNIKDTSKVPKNVGNIARESNYLTKTRVITEQGRDLGQISDILFDPKTGKVEEFEVTQGLANLKSGKKTFKITDILTIGEDATIVRAATEEKFESQAKESGIQGALNQAVNTIKEKAPAIKEKAQEQIEKARDKTTDKIREVKENPQTQETLNRAKQSLNKTKEDIKEKGDEFKNKGGKLPPPPPPTEDINIYTRTVTFSPSYSRKVKKNNENKKKGGEK